MKYGSACCRILNGYKMNKRYNTVADALRDRFGHSVGKICIDGGFTCPNRDGTCGVGGCIFCGERGAGEHIDAAAASIGEQARQFLASDRGKLYERYIAYFQNFSNTYAPPEILRERYAASLVSDNIVGLAIGTRPDCITPEIADVIAEYSKSLYVSVELGLQSSNDKTAELCNRGYKSERFTEAVNLLYSRGIETVAHIIIGLPGECTGTDELAATIDFLNRHPITGVKIHSLYVMEGTRLADMYRAGEFDPIVRGDHIKRAVYCITHLRPDIIIHRVTGDCPKQLLIAPDWNADKDAVIVGIDRSMQQNGLWQGCEYE